MADFQKNELSPVAVIVPHVVAHNLDAHTGIPFLPHMAGYMAAALDRAGYDVHVIDCFGLQPHAREICGEFMLMGVSSQWVADHLDENIKVVFLYCRTVEDLISTEKIIKTVKHQRPDIRICLFENIQTVNSFSLKELVEELLPQRCEAAILGEPENRAGRVAEALVRHLPLNDIPGMAYMQNGHVVRTPDAPFDRDLDSLPFPLWERFPLKGYWIAGFAHPPVDGRRFVPILTSRGCPYKCTFCISPALNPHWRPRSAKNVADEMEYFFQKMGITDFHVSDLNPTVDDQRIRALCYELMARHLPIVWKLAQGTKIETIKNAETLELMAKAGCVFLSFSPETGSPRLLKLINKSFDQEHALEMVKHMNRLNIRTQACFMAGIPGENAEDKNLSVAYVKKLVRAGVDEIAVTIFTPLPGAKLSDALHGYTHYSQLTHSPTWRADYREIEWFRFRMYMTFFLWKLTYPCKILRELTGFFTGRFQTKMEMSIYKQIKFYALKFCPQLFKKLDPARTLKYLREVGSYDK